MKNVVFCSSIPVPLEDEEEFLAAYSLIATRLSGKKGFVSASVHRGLTSSVSHAFLVQFEWADSLSLLQVLRSREVAVFRKHLKWKGTPAIYEPVEF